MSGSKKEAALPGLSETLVVPEPEDKTATELELDELWSFVFKKSRKRWIWIALCRRTRQVVAFVGSDRGETTDKGYINQRATLERRADLVNEPYRPSPSAQVICLAEEAAKQSNF
ncbi:MAG: IS1 family transposase [Blastocatellia bacterium]